MSVFYMGRLIVLFGCGFGMNNYNTKAQLQEYSMLKFDLHITVVITYSSSSIYLIYTMLQYQIYV